MCGKKNGGWILFGLYQGITNMDSSFYLLFYTPVTLWKFAKGKLDPQNIIQFKTSLGYINCSFGFSSEYSFGKDYARQI